MSSKAYLDLLVGFQKIAKEVNASGLVAQINQILAETTKNPVLVHYNN